MGAAPCRSLCAVVTLPRNAFDCDLHLGRLGATLHAWGDSVIRLGYRQDSPHTPARLEGPCNTGSCGDLHADILRKPSSFLSLALPGMLPRTLRGRPALLRSWTGAVLLRLLSCGLLLSPRPNTLATRPRPLLGPGPTRAAGPGAPPDTQIPTYNRISRSTKVGASTF